ncbi:uncharacterized protein [Primulina huaijiensis]|uniref:uncharacterized protein n=1 Tax=Primulina huaijiensis TaxID=1492673 RepID=UPI003CC709FC
MSQIESNRVKAMWRRWLSSAFRTAIACSIVGGATLYGPKVFTSQVTFPAFSYVTVILIINDATLGDAFRSCWLALYATVQGVLPAIFSLWLIGPSRLNVGTTSVVAGLSGFIIALPENTHLISKRIALGQIVLVYVIGFANGEKTDPIMHPVHVAASTALGVAACVLAMLFPYPSLVFCEVKENCKLYIQNASQRLKLYMKAFSAEDSKVPKGLISQAKFLNATATKLLKNIESKQESMKWEIIPAMFFKSYNKNPAEKLTNVESILKGMEISLTNYSEFPVKILDSELKNGLLVLEEQFLNQVNNMAVEKTILPQSDTEMDLVFSQTMQTSTVPLTSKDFPSLFFIFCLKLMQGISTRSVLPQVSSKPGSELSNEHSQKVKNWSLITKLWSFSPITVNRRRLMPALRCSLSLGFAVLFGLIYSKENGFWSGLPVAISHAAAREATLKVANIKAQGTVLGTVYGVMGCFLFEKYVQIRFISLLPWFIFCSFLRTSKMYGQAGGISAVIGAVLILGRDNFGLPSEFAIARIVETFIGLSCSIMVDMLLQPTRAAVLAKIQLSKSLELLHESVGSVSIGSWGEFFSGERQKKLKIHVNDLGKFMEEAEMEPNFWFLPFHSACYSKLKGSLSRMVDFLLFGSHALMFVKQELSRNGDCKVLKHDPIFKLEADLNLLKDQISSAIELFKEVSLVKSLEKMEREFEKRRDSLDLELGKSSVACAIQWSRFDDDELEKNTNSFLQHLDELVDLMEVEKDGEELKNQVILSLCSLMFCMRGLLRETKEIDKAMKELVQWENPSSQVDMCDILCKICALGKSVKC